MSNFLILQILNQNAMPAAAVMAWLVSMVPVITECSGACHSSARQTEGGGMTWRERPDFDEQLIESAGRRGRERVIRKYHRVPFVSPAN